MLRGIDNDANVDLHHVAPVKRGSPWQVYKRLLGYVVEYKARLFVSIALAMVVAMSFGGGLMSIGEVLKLVFDSEAKVLEQIDDKAEKIQYVTETMDGLIGWSPQGVDTWYEDTMTAWMSTMRADEFKSLIWLSVFIFAVAVVIGLARFAQEYLAASITLYITVGLGVEMYNNVIHLPLRFFEKRTTGEIAGRLSNDVFMAGRGLNNVFIKLFREPFTALAFMSVALLTDWKLTLIGLCVLPPIGYVLLVVGRKIRKRARRSLEKVATVVTVAKESVAGIQIVKGFCMEDYVGNRMAHEYTRLRREGLKMLKAEATVGPATDIVMALGIIAFVLISGHMVLDEDDPLLVSDLFTLSGALVGMLNPVRKLASVNNAIQMSVASSNRVFEFIDATSDITDVPDAVALEPIQESLRFDNVHFSYDGETDVLKGVSFEVRKGEMIAIVGESGAGKSTIAKLVPRFYDVDDGAITIDGTDLRQATLRSLREQIGIVTQESLLFNEPVAVNIAAGSDDYSEQRIREAACAAHADGFIEALPQGYATVIGEAGGTLSGGQRQRLAIARALVKDPAILILDEATSSLDSESEQAIQQAIEEFVVGRTTIVIAHRLSTIQRADRILVLDKEQGRIVEQGTHEELLQRPGSVYRRLYEVQFATGE